ncbi:MAG: glucose 1-dehydrogenase [Deinococcota bacterium]|nr:glucose 1-dehydrogenase [Deinococcota bacterium]
MADPTSFLQRHFALPGKAALVTGASGGIGRAFAVALAQAGALVGIHGRAKGRLEETRALIDGAGGRSVILTAELGEVAACKALIEEAHAALGRLDILVNNAGMNRRKPLVEMTPDDFDVIMAANLRSALLLSQAAHPIMREQGGGKIVHVGSITSTYGLGGVSVYGMSKSALAHLTKTMAVEWAGDNIQVNCLAPGRIETERVDELDRALATKQGKSFDEVRASSRSSIPMGRLGEPDEFGQVAAFLCSDAAKYMTGSTVFVDGGSVSCL